MNKKLLPIGLFLASAGLIWAGGSAINSGHVGTASTAQTQIVDLPRFTFPGVVPNVLTTPTLSGTTLFDVSGTTGSVTTTFAAPKSGEVATIGFRTATVTTGCTVDVRLETVTSGDPSGTLADTNSNITQVIADTDDNTWFTCTLTGAATVTQGTLYAIKIEYSSGSTPAIQIAYLVDGKPAGFADAMMPHPQEGTGSTYTSRVNTVAPAMGIGYDDGDWPILQGLYPVTDVDSTIFDNADTPDSRGFRINLAATLRVAGFWWWGEPDTASTWTLYDSDGQTALTTVAIGANDLPTTFSGVQHRYFVTSQVLTKGTNYYLAWESDSTSTVAIYTMSFDSAEIASSYRGGAALTGTSAKNPQSGGAWTDTPAELPFGGLIIDGVESGGAGFSSHIIIE